MKRYYKTLRRPQNRRRSSHPIPSLEGPRTLRTWSGRRQPTGSIAPPEPRQLRRLPAAPAPLPALVLDKKLAAVENVGWLVLYLLAAFGVRPLWKKQPALSGFIWTFFGATGLTAALTQGNLGTAFRHRLQVLWLVVLVAAVGGERILHRRAQRRVEV